MSIVNRLPEFLKGNFSSRKEINNFLRKNNNITKINYHSTYDWRKNKMFLRLQESGHEKNFIERKNITDPNIYEASK